jgi:hypothetical protein
MFDGLTSPDPVMREQCYWFFGNVVATSNKFKDYILSKVPVLDICMAEVNSRNMTRSLLLVICWFVSNMAANYKMDKENSMKCLFIA